MWSFDFSDMLNATITVQRKTDPGDAGGRDNPTWNPVYTNIPCSIQPIRMDGRKQEFAGALESEVSHVIYSNQVLSIQDGDRLYDGTSYYVNCYREPQGGTGEVFAMYALKVN